MGLSIGRSSSAASSHDQDNETIAVSNLSKTKPAPSFVAPCVATMADDDPVSDQGDIFDEGRDDQEIMSSINAVDVHRTVWTPSADIAPEEPDGPPEVGAPEDFLSDDPEAIRAQIDTGAFVSCTDLQHMLHDYREFSKERPSPVRLMPATENSDAVPKGYGYLHVPAHNQQGHLAVRTFFHPALRTTVIDERDFVRAAG